MRSFFPSFGLEQGRFPFFFPPFSATAGAVAKPLLGQAAYFRERSYLWRVQH